MNLKETKMNGFGENCSLQQKLADTSAQRDRERQSQHDLELLYVEHDKKLNSTIDNYIKNCTIKKNK